MKRKQKRQLGIFMALMTVFSSVFVLTYAALYMGSGNGLRGSVDHSDTLYRRLAAESASGKVSAFGQQGVYTLGSDISSDGSVGDVPRSDAPSTSPSPEHTPMRSLSMIKTVKVQNADTGVTYETELEAYVVGAVLAEMPANAPAEALKAQAVACRTLAVRFILDSEKDVHNGADICTSPAHCQGYIDTEGFVTANGEVGRKAVESVRNAVSATRGSILLYDGEPIVAAFHASSGGKTASSLEVWGGDVDYLVSVETEEMYDELLSADVIRNVSFKKGQLLSLLANAGVKNTEALNDRPFSEWLSGVVRTESGRVDFVEIGAERVEGDTLRRALGLRSCDFSFSYTEDTVTFTTVGYGHGVGMSQLGAVEMARNGESYYSILSRYYPGCRAGTVGEL